jgi:hypothetical protein
MTANLLTAVVLGWTFHRLLSLMAYCLLVGGEEA